MINNELKQHKNILETETIKENTQNEENYELNKLEIIDTEPIYYSKQKFESNIQSSQINDIFNNLNGDSEEFNFNPPSTEFEFKKKSKIKNKFKQEIKTILRIRPCPEGCERGNYTIKNNNLELEVVLENNVKTFTFSKAFDEDCSQLVIFNEACKRPLNDFLTNNKSSLIFTYGMTCSGKTFTVIGSEEDPGILYRSVNYILNNSNIAIKCQYYEIYNEECYDLLHQYNTNKLKKKKTKSLNMNNNHNTRINKLNFKCLLGTNLKEKSNPFENDSITEVTIENMKEFKKILKYGCENKSHAVTGLNANSSRSHSIFKIFITDNEKTCSYIIVDLAGSERLKRTEVTGINVIEASKINSSLSVLGKCLEAMRINSNASNLKKKVPIPFRESKLTMLFQEYFLGQFSIIMITNINPRKQDYEESIRALNFSCICKEIIPNKSIIIPTFTQPKTKKQEDKATGEKINKNTTQLNIDSTNEKTKLFNSNIKVDEKDETDEKTKVENMVLKKELGDLKSMLKQILVNNEKKNCKLVQNLSSELEKTLTNLSIDPVLSEKILATLEKDKEKYSKEANVNDSIFNIDDIFPECNKDYVDNLMAKLKKGINLVLINPTIKDFNIFTYNKRFTANQKKDDIQGILKNSIEEILKGLGVGFDFTNQ